MEKNPEYGFVVIGAAIPGFVSAVIPNGLGQKVAIAPKRMFGGNCGSYTCLPKKTLIPAEPVTRLLNHLRHFGLKNTLPNGYRYHRPHVLR